MNKNNYYQQVILLSVIQLLCPLWFGVLITTPREIVKKISVSSSQSFAIINGMSILVVFSLILILLRYLYQRRLITHKHVKTIFAKHGVRITDQGRSFKVLFIENFPYPFGRYIEGYLDNTFVRAHIEKKMLTYNWFPPVTVLAQTFERGRQYYGLKENNVSNYLLMNCTSQINLFYLFSSKLNVEVEVEGNGTKEQIINTECDVINRVLADFTGGPDWFHWKVTFNDKWLRLSIIGGAWQGDLLKKNIENGISFFKAMVKEMQGKYPEKSWEDYQVQWNDKTWKFDLKEINSRDAEVSA